MSDKNEGGGKNNPLSFHSVPAMVAQSLMDILVKHGLPFAWKKTEEATDRKIEDTAARARNKHYFAAAVTKLRQRGADGAAAADCINDFMQNHLDNDTDREDFQHNSAKVGTDKDDKMEDTVQFLYDLAQLPDHQARELCLTALGFIGARSVDMGERALDALTWLRDHTVDLPGEAKQFIGERITALDGWIKSPAVQNWTPGMTAKTKTADALTRAQAKLAAAKARR